MCVWKAKITNVEPEGGVNRIGNESSNTHTHRQREA